MALRKGEQEKDCPLEQNTGQEDRLDGDLLEYGHGNKATNNLSDETIRKATVFGSVMASFTVEDFSLNRLRKLSWSEIEERFRRFQTLTAFEGL